MCSESTFLFLNALPSLNVGPESTFGPSQLVLGIELQWLLGLGAGGEGELPHDGHHADLGLEEGEPHADTGAGTLAKCLEGVTEKGFLKNKPYDEVSVAAQVSKHFSSIKMHLNALNSM